MDIYDTRYFIINKRFLMMFGLWPNQNYKKKIFLRGLILITLALMLLPQVRVENMFFSSFFFKFRNAIRYLLLSLATYELSKFY